MKTFYLMGITCSGKDYFIELAVKLYPDIFGAVQVGKEFRRRYPPDYFKGSAAPAHTEQEAIDIFKEQHNAAVFAGCSCILVSGQPRRPSQVASCLSYAPGDIIFMYTPDEIVLERIAKRFENDPASKLLSMQRVVNDKVQLYDTIFECLRRNVDFKTINTQEDNVEEIIHQLAKWGDF